MEASSQPTNPPESPETWEADAFVVERSQSLDDDDNDFEESAKTRLGTACNIVTPDAIRDKLVFSKPKGFRVLEESADLRHEVKSLRERSEHKFAVLQNEISRLRLEKEGKWLQEEGLAIRRRFLDCFKRDVLKMPESQRIAAIKAGNKVAHDGNALSDACLFKHENRMDLSTFSQLYGLQYLQVLRYSDEDLDGGIISVLNAYATLLAQCTEGKEISPKLEQAFRSFVKVAERSYPLTPLEDETSQLARSYWEFWQLWRLHR